MSLVTRLVNSGGRVEYGSGVFRVRVEYRSGVFRVRVEYGSGVFRFYGFRVNPTGHDRHVFLLFLETNIGYRSSSYFNIYQINLRYFVTTSECKFVDFKLIKMKEKKVLNYLFIRESTNL